MEKNWKFMGLLWAIFMELKRNVFAFSHLVERLFKEEIWSRKVNWNAENFYFELKQIKKFAKLK